MNITWQEFGVVGLILAFVLIILDKNYNIFKSFKKGDDTSAVVKAMDSNTFTLFFTSLDNNTIAIRELTQTQMELLNFLKTDKAVDIKTQQQNEKSTDELKQKMDKLIDLHTTHIAQCQSTCLKR